MAAPVQTGLPLNCELASGYQVVITALDASGNIVAGVQLEGVSFFVTDILDVSGSSTDNTPAPLLVPVSETV